MENRTTAEKYHYLQKLYKEGNHYIILNSNLFGPYPQPEVPWDISEVQKIATYNPEIIHINRWIMNEILNKSALFDYRTLNVLIRIATGMLNKCDIPKEIQIMFHDNMVENLKSECCEVTLSGLPF
jgi:sensor histidine kinase YesM